MVISRSEYCKNYHFKNLNIVCLENDKVAEKIIGIMLKSGFCLSELLLYFVILSLHKFLNEIIFIKLIPIQTVLSGEVIGECHIFRMSLHPQPPPPPPDHQQAWWPVLGGTERDSVWRVVFPDCFPNPTRTSGPGCFIHSGSNLVNIHGRGH